MKKLVLIYITILFLGNNTQAQNYNDEYEYSSFTKNDKPRAIKYNAFGIADPFAQQMIGGNHVSFRKIGFGLSWRVGARFIQETNNKTGDMPYDTAVKNGLLTGNKSLTYGYSIMPGFAFAVTKKIPLLFSVGVVRQRQLEEYYDVNTQLKGWSRNETETKFNFNFSAQTFIPLGNVFVINVGYDHLPQSFFIGIAISHKYNFIDIDEW